MLRTRARSRGGVGVALGAPAVPSMYKGMADGDSLSSSQIWSVSSTNKERRAAGYITNFAAQSYQVSNLNYTNGFGASGAKIEDMLADQATAITYAQTNDVDFISLMLGANDVEDTSVSVATKTTNYTTFLTAYRDCSAAPYIFVGLPTPRGDWEADLEATRAVYVQRLHDLRAAISSVCASLGSKIVVWDVWNDIVDTGVTNPTTGLNYYPKAGYMATDGVHLIHRGAHWAGKRMFQAFQTTPLKIRVTSLPTVSGNESPNPTLAGTSGTFGTASSGTLPNNTRVERSSGTAATAVCSKETTTIFGVSQETVKIVISGGTAATEEFFFYFEHPEPTKTMDGLTGVEMMCPIKITAATGVLGVYLYGRVIQGSTYTTLDMAYTSGNVLPTDDLPIEWLLRTEPLIVPAGSSTRYQMVVRMRLDGTVSSNGLTVNIGQPTHRRIAP